MPAMGRSWIDYPAIDVPIRQFFVAALPLGSPITHAIALYELGTYHRNYNNSVKAGVSSLLAAYNKYQRNCPGRHLVMFAGYSQGADVTVKAYDSLPRAKQAQIIMANFGDPHFNELDSDVDQGDFDHSLQAIMPHWWGEIAHYFPYYDGSHVHSWCLNGDTICNYSWPNLRHCATSACPHYHYVDTGDTSEAARWAYQTWIALR
jgi:hypothetical protein